CNLLGRNGALRGFPLLSLTRPCHRLLLDAVDQGIAERASRARPPPPPRVVLRTGRARPCPGLGPPPPSDPCPSCCCPLPRSPVVRPAREPWLLHLPRRLG